MNELDALKERVLSLEAGLNRADARALTLLNMVHVLVHAIVKLSPRPDRCDRCGDPWDSHAEVKVITW